MDKKTLDMKDILFFLSILHQYASRKGVLGSIFYTNLGLLKTQTPNKVSGLISEAFLD